MNLHRLLSGGVNIIKKKERRFLKIRMASSLSSVTHSHAHTTVFYSLAGNFKGITEVDDNTSSSKFRV